MESKKELVKLAKNINLHPKSFFSSDVHVIGQLFPLS